ncbi:uncharacterized protein ARMOST_15879 [Armillaria ostoyae]|uniref:Uncharacterized protein n=1 Tax=Armillaria ostoyae TaxID=47428 RepID=A0A284RUP3_ARMOS|nr:uncharacterized protein ARMOST_15879 [Armillaria ostoyae]
MSLATPHRRLTSSASQENTRQGSLPQTGDDLYRPGARLNLKFQSHESSEYIDLAAMVVKRFEPFTSAVVLLVQQLSDSQPLILKLADRRLGYRASNHDDVDTVPWLSSIDDHLRLAVRDIQEGVKPNWFELIHYFENRPDTELWEDWMWEVCTWIGKMSSHDTELSAYRLLHRLQGRYIPRLYGVVRLCITSESIPLHPITDFVEGLVLEYIPGINMDKLNPGIDVSEEEAEKFSSAVLEGFRAIEAENSNIQEPEYSDEEWRRVVRGGPDTRYIRRLLVDPEDGCWKRTVSPFDMSDWHYDKPLTFNKYVESMPDNFRRVTFV